MVQRGTGELVWLIRCLRFLDMSFDSFLYNFLYNKAGTFKYLFLIPSVLKMPVYVFYYENKIVETYRVASGKIWQMYDMFRRLLVCK